MADDIEVAVAVQVGDAGTQMAFLSFIDLMAGKI
jgi:hypothetical protein